MRNQATEIHSLPKHHMGRDKIIETAIKIQTSQVVSEQHAATMDILNKTRVGPMVL